MVFKDHLRKILPSWQGFKDNIWSNLAWLVMTVLVTSAIAINLSTPSRETARTAEDSLTPKAIRSIIKSSKPVMRAEVKAHFIGTLVTCTGRVRELSKTDSNLLNFMVLCDEELINAEDVPSEPPLQWLDENDVITLSGKITAIDEVHFVVKPAKIIPVRKGER